jgi:hypothetical protein
MMLTITERLLLLKTLPGEGDLCTIRTVRETRELLAFDSDIADGSIAKVGEGSDARLEWKEDFEKGIELSKAGERLIADAILALDKQKKLTEAHLGLYEKFVE